MMEGWKSYQGKKVFLQLKSGRVYSGKISKVDDSSAANGLIYLFLIDKFDKLITICSGEIEVIQEEA